MHGLINKAIEVFVRQSYGAEQWQAIMVEADLGFSEFEAMLSYDAATTDVVLDALSRRLKRPRDHLLEDLGTFLMTSPSLPALRRLLRFGGVDYLDFLHSLEDMAGRVRLAVGDLALPALELRECGDGRFSLFCHAGLPGYGHVMLGVLRAMADDYGALALLDLRTATDGRDVIEIQIIQDAYAAGNAFELGGVSA